MLILLPIVAEVKPVAVRTLSDAEFRSWKRQQVALTLEVEDDEHEPAAGPDYIPTPEEIEEADELFRSDWDALADDAMALDAVCSGRSWM